MSGPSETSLVLNIPFWRGTCANLLQALHSQGGLLVVPSAPSLCAAAHEPPLLKAHVEADAAVLDSGYLALILRALGNRTTPRISGHQIIEHLLFSGSAEILPFRQHKVLWVVPSETEKKRILDYLLTQGFRSENLTFYVAPIYRNNFRDTELADRATEFDPDWIILCIGGGRQEKLGFELRSLLKRKVPIICTGAAIAFFSGGQAKIPRWADRLYLGWLMRILDNPKQFAPRYLSALALPFALLRIAKLQRAKQ